MGHTILVTGAAGFIGLHVVKQLLGRQTLTVVPGRDSRLDRASSSATARRPLIADPRIEAVAGDIADPKFMRSLVTQEVQHGVSPRRRISGALRKNDLGLRPGGQSGRHPYPARCLPRRWVAQPRFIFTSSIAAFGIPVPSRIDDDTPGIPSLSYGTQKRMCELLIDDYTRRGHIDGRVLRLPGIVVRPPNPNGALSAFNSDMIREPVAGREVILPVSHLAQGGPVDDVGAPGRRQPGARRRLGPGCAGCTPHHSTCPR